MLEAVNLVAAVSTDVAAAAPVATSRLPSLLVDLLREKVDDDTVTLQVLLATWRLLQHAETFRELVYGLRVVDELLELQRTLHDSAVAAAAAAKKAASEAARRASPAGKGKGNKDAIPAAPPGEEPATVALRSMIGRCLDTVVDVDQVDAAPEGGSVSDTESDAEEGKDGGSGKMSSRRKRLVAGRQLGHYAQQVRERRFRVHNREWLETINADLAAEQDGRAEEAAFLRAQRQRAAMHDGGGHGDSLGSEYDSALDDGEDGGGAAGDWDYGMRGRHGNIEMDMGMLEDDDASAADDSMDGQEGGVPGQWDTHGYGMDGGADGDFNQVSRTGHLSGPLFVLGRGT